MTTSVSQLISELNVTDETHSVEAKEISGGELGKSIQETISAFSNEPGLGGGSILLGVKRVSSLFPVYEVSGVDQPDKIASDVVSVCQSVFNVPVRPVVTQEEVDGKCVILVDISEADSHKKPVYIQRKGMNGGAFRRIGGADIRCSDDDLFALFSQRTDEPMDSRVLADAEVSDIDGNAVDAYRKERSLAHPSAQELNWTDDDLVFSLGGTKKVDGHFKPTNAGVLLFGSQQALRRLVPTCRVDYIRVPGRTWVEDPERRFDAIEMRGSLISLIPRVISAVLDDIPKTFSIDGGPQRVDRPALPEVAIREAVVNAVMHRSYAINQPIQVIRYANRLEIRNPGYSLKSEDRFDEPGSQIRNPTIAEVLHETRFAENKGSGIRVMRRVMQEAGLTPPTFNSDRVSETFTAFFLFHHFLNEDDLLWLAGFKDFSLNDEQLRAVIFARELGAIDNKSFRDLTGLDTLKASKNLTALRDAGILESKGSGNQAYYAPGPELLARLSLGGSSQDSDETFQGKDSKLGTSSKNIGFNELTPSLKSQLTHLRLKRRRKREDVEAFILAACAWKALSAKEISELLSNNQTYVQQTFLSQMVERGALEYRYPEMVNHPDQKYKAKGVPKGG